MKTLVSVCIPVYNGAPFIKKTIEMVLKQDYDNMEVLVSDNASTDDTVNEIKKIKDERVTLFQNKTNLGMGGNWNSLIEKARGEYIIIVCADDYIFPGAISEKAKVLDENSDVVLAFSSSYVVNEKGKKMFKRRPFRGNKKLEKDKFQRELFVKYNFCAEPPNNMMRKSAMKKTGQFDEQLWYNIDWDYYLRLLNHGNAYYIDKPLEGFRISASSATGSSLNGASKILADENIFISKYKSGNVIQADQSMFDEREKNVRRRLNKKIFFMKLSGLMSIFKKK